MGKKNRPVSEETEINISDLLNKINFKYISLALLFLFVVFGFYLRFYHAQYPVIGYHNWKTAHYLTEARNFAREGFFKYGFFVPMRQTLESINEQPDGAHNDTFPTIPVFVAIAFRLFGESLVVARLVTILFSIGSIIFSYLLIKELFEREDLAILTSFLVAINPLFIFFSHTAEVSNAALFFMLAGFYFYVGWIKHDLTSSRYARLYLAAGSVVFGILTKYNFTIAAFPILAVFPYTKFFKNIRKKIMPVTICALIASSAAFWFYYMEYYVRPKIFGANFSEQVLQSTSISNLVDFKVLWNSDFWRIMKSYIADNFSLIGISFSILGCILFLFMFFSKNKDKLGYKFMSGYLLGSVIFFFVMGFKLSGHNYHQFPVAPLIIFFISFFIYIIAKNIESILKVKWAGVFIILVLVFVIPFPIKGYKSSLYFQSIESKDRMFNTQYPGLDLAGEYIKEHSQPNERFFHSSGQSFGVLWHADRYGYKPPSSADYFKRAEDEFDVTFALAYQWGIQTYFQNQEVFEYLKNNYRLVQFAFIPVSEQQVQPLYFLFRKGGTFNESELNGMLQNKQLLARQYYYTSGPYEIRYINLE